MNIFSINKLKKSNTKEIKVWLIKFFKICKLILLIHKEIFQKIRIRIFLAIKYKKKKENILIIN